MTGPLFTGERSESTALFTFASDPFAASTVANGPLGVGIDAKGAFRIYLRDTGGATFDDPDTFSAGRCIATFERVSIVATANTALSPSLALLTNVFTARLVASEAFALGDRNYNFRQLVGHAITQWGVAATGSLDPPPNYSAVVPFVGSAIRVGQ